LNREYYASCNDVSLMMDSQLTFKLDKRGGKYGLSVLTEKPHFPAR